MTNSVYHPILNGNGTYKASDGKFWYETTVTLNSVADCFKPANIGTVNGRPDGKSDKYVYAENIIDVREYSKILTPYEVELVRDDKEENGVEEMVFVFGTLNGTIHDTNRIQFTSVPSSILELVPNHGDLYYEVGNWILTYEDSTQFYAVKIAYIVNNNGVIGVRTKDNDLLTTFTGKAFVTLTKPILSSGTSLSIDLIGAPNA